MEGGGPATLRNRATPGSAVRGFHRPYLQPAQLPSFAQCWTVCILLSDVDVAPDWKHLENWKLQKRHLEILKGLFRKRGKTLLDSLETCTIS